MIKDKKIDSYIYNLLLKTYRSDAKGLRKKIWETCWSYACNTFSGPVSTNMHGKRTLINFGHSYQLFARRFKNWNSPLIELAFLSFKMKNAPIRILDIGASIGDTVRLLESNCPSNMIEHFICVEGDPEFFDFLKENLNDTSKYTLIKTMLSDTSETIPSLVRTHLGTASAQGNTSAEAVSLDYLFDKNGLQPIDLIKIDVDGFDGRIIKGAKKILDTFHPAVIFEWDPSLCKKTGNNWLDHFLVLNELGYTQFLWFSKYGDFSHFMNTIDTQSINQIAEICLSDKHDWNWHYDIVALHNTSTINTQELAVLKHAKARRSWY